MKVELEVALQQYFDEMLGRNPDSSHQWVIFAKISNHDLKMLLNFPTFNQGNKKKILRGFLRTLSEGKWANLTNSYQEEYQKVIGVKHPDFFWLRDSTMLDEWRRKKEMKKLN